MLHCTKNKIRLLQRIMWNVRFTAQKLTFVTPAKAGGQHPMRNFKRPELDSRLRRNDEVYIERRGELSRFVDDDPFKTLIVIIGRTKLAFDHRCPFEIMADGELLRDADAAMCLNGILADEIRAA
jgi:hypothetical protein